MVLLAKPNKITFRRKILIIPELILLRYDYAMKENSFTWPRLIGFSLASSCKKAGKYWIDQNFASLFGKSIIIYI